MNKILFFLAISLMLPSFPCAAASVGDGVAKAADVVKEEKTPVNERDVDLLARVAYAEAGNQGDMGMRMVIDCVLNQVDDPRFPDTIEGVLYAPGNFTTVSSGRIWMTPSTEAWEAAKAKLANRTDYNVLYFRTGGYHSFGTPLYKHGAHYFSGK